MLSPSLRRINPLRLILRLPPLRVLQGMLLRMRVLLPLLLLTQLPLSNSLFPFFNPILLRLHHISPLILARVSFVMDFLLNHVFVLWVIGIQNLNSLPSSLAGGGIRRFEREGDDDDGEGEALGVNTGLDEFLLRREVGVAAYEAEGCGDGSDPGAEDDAVAVL